MSRLIWNEELGQWQKVPNPNHVSLYEPYPLWYLCTALQRSPIDTVRMIAQYGDFYRKVDAHNPRYVKGKAGVVLLKDGTQI